MRPWSQERNRRARRTGPGRGRLPALRCAARADDGRPREVAALPDGADRRGARARRDVLSAPRPGLRALLARADPRARGARGDLHRVRLLLGVLGLVGRARADATSTRCASGSGSGRTASSSSSPRTTGISCSTSSRRASRCWGSSRRRTSPRRRSREASRRSPSSSGRSSARGSPRERGHADLVLGNNVLAQVPDINDFAAGVAALLAPDGTATFEFPHLAKLVEHLEYDTIYHEHFSYFSLHSIRAIFGAQGLDARRRRGAASHGGSLRVFLRHAEAGDAPVGRGRRASSPARTSRDCAIPPRTRASQRGCASPSGRSSTS